jgi:hypothetical protein
MSDGESEEQTKQINGPNKDAEFPEVAPKAPAAGADNKTAPHA